ncbi:response regulator [Qipengyuania atrilutea]|uniref:Response regulator transcription factor n=1 Tax=Qipengyuania atrilutea TaxID=2744473 RepID=A0A850H1P7_9SPHN|nr:response regulator [Actirhodobacter atriluteus]NVD44450.1 response regulator transcription factor [Actirhodobacter atriluteus]
MTGARILIVDDDELLCEMLASLFRMSGYEVTVAHDGEAGLTKLAAEGADLIVLDLVMPKMDGLRFLRILPERIAQPPRVIVASASATPEMDKKLGQAEIAAVVRKPVKPALLLATVAEALEKPTGG